MKMENLGVDFSELDSAFSKENISLFLQNISWVINATRNFDYSLIERFAYNRRVSDPAFYGLLCAYSMLVMLGALGNSLVVCAVVRKASMRTTRNVFIINLAISDLLLCLVTMPLTLMEILTRYWPLGNHAWLCKLGGSLQATSVFVSTITITAIALDRYQIIVYPTKESLQRAGAFLTLFFIWLTGFCLATPLFLWRTLKHYPISLPGLDIHALNYCVEEWPFDHGRAFYSFFSVLFQYALPIITVSIAYARICRKLRFRMVALSNMSKNSSRKESEDQRVKKTNTLLVCIALIFGISWMPLNTYNLMLDFHVNPFGEDTQSMLVTYAICHMISMSSACSNPMLYGWLNENFRKEFREIGKGITTSICAHNDGTGNSCLHSIDHNKRLLKNQNQNIEGITSRQPVVIYTKASDVDGNSDIELDGRICDGIHTTSAQPIAPTETQIECSL